MTAGFIAALLEGFEDTLDHVLNGLGEGDLLREVEALQAHIAGKRRQLETMDDSESTATPARTPYRD